MDCGPDGIACRRLSAIHLLLLGGDYHLVLRHSRVHERTIRLWIERFNKQGIDGLIYKPQTGRPRIIPAAQESSVILPLVDDPSLAEKTHWKVTKLCGWLREEKQLDSPTAHWCATFTNEHNYARRIPRRMPEPPDRDEWEKQRENFGAELINLLEDPACDVFFGDEAGFEGDPRLRAKMGQAWLPSYSPDFIRSNDSGSTSRGITLQAISPNIVTNSTTSSSTRSGHCWTSRKPSAPSAKPTPNNGKSFWQSV